MTCLTMQQAERSQAKGLVRMMREQMSWAEEMELMQRSIEEQAMEQKRQERAKMQEIKAKRALEEFVMKMQEMGFVIRVTKHGKSNDKLENIDNGNGCADTGTMYGSSANNSGNSLANLPLIATCSEEKRADALCKRAIVLE